MNDQTHNSWTLSRRNFVKMALASGLLSQVPFASSCIRESEKTEARIKIAETNYTIEHKLIQDVQNILMPKDDLGPGALELKSDLYLIWVLNDQKLDPWDGEHIIKGFKKLETAANNQFHKSFTSLKQDKQEELIARISVMDWGKDWLSKMLTIIFESMFANPNYGSNPDGIGWKWLNHQAGFPQPDSDQIYPSILNLNNQRYKL